ncbi:MAG TPA: HEAT repeat domain-containing protein [Terracidiphilus sp.]|nr:HEAT repeat domain-containing protein [Terracidiphilus sp.]
MIAFCTHCWTEIDARDTSCFHCGTNLNADRRSYEEKLVCALEHPLPAARARVCWLIGENKVRMAVPHLMRMVTDDPDLYVQRAALEALGALRDRRAFPLLIEIGESKNRFLASAARKSLKSANVG